MALAIHMDELRLGIARTGGRIFRHGALDGRKIVRRQMHVPAMPSASASRSRRRAPMSGTMSWPCAATQAIAICATRDALRLRDLAQRLDQRQIPVDILALETRAVARGNRPCAVHRPSANGR